MFTQGYRIMVKLKLVQSVCCKLYEATQMFMLIAYVREMTVEKSCVANMLNWLFKGDDCEEILYGEYGSFEHLLFLWFQMIMDTKMVVYKGCN